MPLLMLATSKIIILSNKLYERAFQQDNKKEETENNVHVSELFSRQECEVVFRVKCNNLLESSRFEALPEFGFVTKMVVRSHFRWIIIGVPFVLFCHFCVFRGEIGPIESRATEIVAPSTQMPF